ncbi:MAG: hypothetical protein WC623_24075 [Pedobacter sp.]|uniref:hypothetical protein n=1 Tax=Pedobacter sp. TaxID=1411316 RepID=UPI0035651040
MKAILSLIDNNYNMRAWLKQSTVDYVLQQKLQKTVKSPWVAEIRKDGDIVFIKSHIDFSSSNGMGTRGVSRVFILESGNKYKTCTYTQGKAVIINYYVNEKGDIIKHEKATWD